MTRVVCVIPARMGSSRYPGKPLESLLGLPLVLHVWERCRLLARFERVVIATCDAVIQDAAARHGAEAVMTADSHERATDRVCEAIGHMDLGLADDDLVVMVQGDEVMVSPEMLDSIVAAYEATRPPVVNLVSKMISAADHDDVNVVKVVAAPDGRALYMSRAPIPSRARIAAPPMFQQTGVIAFAAAFLRKYGEMPQTPLEKVESIDMLRILENGLPLQLVFTDTETIGIDTPEERVRGEAMLAADPVTARYLEPHP